jgi:hypothetical protein
MTENKRCAIWWCERKRYALGLCKAHWAALKRYGSPYGKYPEHMMKIDGLFLSAYMVARGVTEFATEFDQTEFDQSDFAEFIKNPTEFNGTCPFCMEKNNDHKTACIVNLSKDILKNTGCCYNKYLPDTRKG